MLYGCQNLYVYTNHKNNTLATIQTQRALRWCLYLDEYGAQLKYIKGGSNALANALFFLSLSEEQD